MTAEQKGQAARFLDMADDYLRSGFYAGERAYTFASSLPPAAFPAGVFPPGSAAFPPGASSAGSAAAGSAGVSGYPAERISPERAGAELRKIAAEIEQCRNCPLSERRQNTVSGEGVSAPLAMIIGEGPGADEDAGGRPFVGPAGQLLDKMLSAIGLSRQTNCFIANVVKCRPPGNRAPEPAEKAACLPFLRRQIEVLRPQAILAAGRVSAQTLLDTTESISSLRGRWAEWRNFADSPPVQLLPTFHPSYLLREENQKPLAWEDLKKFSRRLATLNAAYDAATVELRKKHKI